MVFSFQYFEVKFLEVKFLMKKHETGQVNTEKGETK